jgi:hypothetical protein
VLCCGVSSCEQNHPHGKAVGIDGETWVNGCEIRVKDASRRRFEGPWSTEHVENPLKRLRNSPRSQAQAAAARFERV